MRRLISADDHVQEHPTVWTDRVATKFKERVPQLAEQDDGTQRWRLDGTPLELRSVALAGALTSDRTVEPTRWEDVPTPAYEPASRLTAMDAAGVSTSVLYPTVAGAAGEAFGRLEDRDLELACVTAYNDWLIDEWVDTSDRFVAQCLTPRWPIEAAVSEVERAVGRGHRGVIFPAVPVDLGNYPHINDDAYDPLWRVCQELGVPVCLHSGSTKSIQFPPYHGLSTTLSDALGAITGPVSSVRIVANHLFSPIPQKFPDLSFIFSHTSFGWGAYELETADHQFERQRLHLEGHTTLPSEIFRRQCYLTGWFDKRSLGTKDFIGTSNLLWSTNFPWSTSTWPTTNEFLDLHFGEMPEEVASSILHDNAARLYNLGA